MPVLPPAEPRYLSLAEAASVASVSVRTLRRAISATCLRAHRLGRLVRIETTELRRWIEADGAAPAPGAGHPARRTARG